MRCEGFAFEEALLEVFNGMSKCFLKVWRVFEVPISAPLVTVLFKDGNYLLPICFAIAVEVFLGIVTYGGRFTLFW